jgi:hypothetical protein
MIYTNWKRLSPTNQDEAQSIADYAYPNTIEGCWKELDRRLNVGRISQSQYDEIRAQVTFYYEKED